MAPPMSAAIYARKSTDQSGIADDQKSVVRQVDHARAYADRKGWIVDDAYVYVDDGISGAEFANRPGFLRLMTALKPRPPFQILIMSEESRLGREAIETAYALKQLVTAGVRVFFYLEDRERTLNSPIEKAMLSLQTMGDEMEREKARMRVTTQCFARREPATAAEVACSDMTPSGSSMRAEGARTLSAPSTPPRPRSSGESLTCARPAPGTRGSPSCSTRSTPPLHDQSRAGCRVGRPRR